MSKTIKFLLITVGVMVLLPLILIFLPVLFALLIIAGVILLKLKYPMIKGAVGERFVNQSLSSLGSNYIVYHDIFIPNGQGGTTQVDHIVTSPYGIFVIETKHYEGWIFGEEKQRYWTQVIYKRKEKFLNPIWQNYGHIQALNNYIGKENSNYIYSIIAFSQRSTFKFRDNFASAKVIQYPQLVEVIKERNIIRLRDYELQEINQALEGLLIKDEKVKRELKKKHVQALKNNRIKKVMGHIQQKNVCPRCGGELALRRGKFGSFYGCSNFPKCRYTNKIT